MNSRPGHAIKRAEQALMSQKSEALRPFDLTVPQYAALMVLYFSPGASGAQLARACVVTPQTMATVLANLEEDKGLIEHTPSSVHHKVLVTKLTRTSRALVKKADVQAKAVEDRVAAAFSPQEQELLPRTPQERPSRPCPKTETARPEQACQRTHCCLPSDLYPKSVLHQNPDIGQYQIRPRGEAIAEAVGTRPGHPRGAPGQIQGVQTCLGAALSGAKRLHPGAILVAVCVACVFARRSR